MQTNSQDNRGAPKLRVRQNGYNLVQKKVTKTVVVVAEYTCIVYLYASDGGTSRSGPRWAVLSCDTLDTPHGALAAQVLLRYLLLTERMHTAMQIPSRNQRNSFLHIPKTGCHCL